MKTDALSDKNNVTGLRGGNQHLGRGLLSLTGERYHCPLGHHKRLIYITECFSKHFLKSAGRKDDRDGPLIAGEFIDRLKTHTTVRKHWQWTLHDTGPLNYESTG